MAYTNFKIFRVLQKQCFIYRDYCAGKAASYKDTILLPKTDFKARHPGNQRAEVDARILRDGDFASVYEWQRKGGREPEYVLHDGPPYANGDLHMGHAVNKILKDICNRSQVLQGRRVHYTPGWDCHGLPIELKALERAHGAAGAGARPPPPEHVRRLARDFAREAVDRQKASFESWGVMADWQQQCYLTMSPAYVKNQLRQFCKMHEKGLIYRAKKPVYWSPSSQHRVLALTWTTTPWSLVGNQAICYNPELRYSLVQLQGSLERYVVATELVPAVSDAIQRTLNKIAEFKGGALEGCTYTSPLNGRRWQLRGAGHVSGAAGTGLVHTAPAHGPDDFLLALSNNMPVECYVDEAGCYTGLGNGFDGLDALTDGQTYVLKQLGDHLVHSSDYIHSYPLDWRTKQPVILRASHQWFIDTSALKQKALAELEKVRIMPESSSGQFRAGLRSQVERRPYWCVSRQRAWGTPIPAVYIDRDTPIVHSDVVERMCTLIDKKGADCWWQCDVEDLVPENVVKEYKTDYHKLTKGQDIMDIWLDSGLSWSATLEGRTADVYVEGLDQFTGWFQSSLLTSVALTGKSPYKSIFVHGFVVDENGRKMSKSLGNVLEPRAVTSGGRDPRSEPAYGVDTLRWWVACHASQHTQVVISKKLLDDCHSEVLRMRNSFKFLLGAIADMRPADFHVPENLNFLDRHMIRELYAFTNEIVEHYNNFRFNHASKLILNFMSNQVSALYCHCVKDRLYCAHKDSDERRAAQMVLHTTLLILCHAIGPVMPGLTEEVWMNHPLYEKVPFFKSDKIPALTPENLEEEDLEVMSTLLNIRKELQKSAGKSKIEQLEVQIEAKASCFDRLKVIKDEVLCEIMQAASVQIVQTDASERDWRLRFDKTSSQQCPRCRKYNLKEQTDKCTRCAQVLGHVGKVL